MQGGQPWIQYIICDLFLKTVIISGCDSSTQTIDDGEDRPSSERRLSTSSISSKDSDKPKYCACCYCELVGHPNPGSQNTHNYEFFREKLRKKLEDRRRELCPEHQSNFNTYTLESSGGCGDSKSGGGCGGSKKEVDDRSLEELVSYIEGKEGKETKRKKRKSKPKDKSEVGCEKEHDIKKETKHRHTSGELTKHPKNEAKTEEEEKGGGGEEEEMSFSFHLDKYESLSKEQRSLLLCGYRVDDHEMYKKQNQLVESMKLPRDMTERSNRNNIPNGRLKPNFPFLKTIDKEGDLSAKPLDKTDSEKAREAIIVETLKRERPRPEPVPKPKIDIQEEYRALSKQSATLLANMPKQTDHSNTPYGPPPPPPPPPPPFSQEATPRRCPPKQTRPPKIEPRSGAALKKQPELPKSKEPITPHSTPHSTTQPKPPLKLTKSEPASAPKRPAEPTKTLQKYDMKCNSKDEESSSKKKKFKKKKKRNESLG